MYVTTGAHRHLLYSQRNSHLAYVGLQFEMIYVPFTTLKFFDKVALISHLAKQVNFKAK